MSTLNEHHEPVQPDDLHDRLLDVALTEVAGGQTPPDLSVRILAARDAARLAKPQPAAAGSYSRRFKWISVAVAASLLIGMGTYLLSNGQSRSKVVNLSSASGRLTEAKKNRLSNPQHKTSSLPQATSAQQGLLAFRGESLAQDAPRGVKWDTNSALVERYKPASPDQLNMSAMDDVAAVADPQAPASSAPTSAPAFAPVEQKLNESLIGTRLNQHSLATRSPNQIGLSAGDQPAATNPGQLPARGGEGTPNSSMGLEWHYTGETTTVGVNKSVDYSGPTAPMPGLLAKDEKEVRLGIAKTESFFTQLGNQSPTADGVGPRLSGDQYVPIVENPFIKAEGGAAISTFSIDVDTASYANVRQFLLEINQLPPPDAVRIEELVNYFQYDYTPPKADDEAPFAAHVEVAGCPWNAEHRLARIAVKGREMDRTKRPKSNLVFLVDVSGSMDEPAKLPLVVYGLQQMARELGENDRVAIVVYASSEGLVLPSTNGMKQDTILAALRKLQAGGSTAGGAGIQLAYQIAEDNFIKGGTNRVILCTDGDFNVGVTSTAELQRLVERKAKDTGVFLSVLGFGRGNLNDAMMEAISDHGNGNYHYVDNRTEARRVLVQEMAGTLVTIAKDVKIQVEFNPAQVAGYRLIGYENRMLRTEDFNDDKKDAGEIGAGHTVTALYEIIPAGKKVGIGPVDDLKYQQRATDVAGSDDEKPKSADFSKELLTLKMRYKAPDGDTSKKLEWPITDTGKAFGEASDDFQFATAVAGFGLLLRDSQFKGNLTFAADLELAQAGLGPDEHGYRAEFLDMVRKAKQLKGE
jgi:Ca-activated chloride channel homolog